MREENEFTTHELIRESFQWGTYGKLGNEPLKHILLKDISDGHLKNIIQHLCSAGGGFGETMGYMLTETSYRNHYGIKVHEKPNLRNFKFGR